MSPVRDSIFVRSRAFVVGGILVAGAASAAWADQTAPQPGRPGSRQETLATLRVTLPAGDGLSTVVLLRRHGRDHSPIAADASWFGVCLPDRKQLEEWTKKEPRRPERRLWQRALQRRGYEAFVFLTPGSDAKPRPACHGVADGMSMKQTDVHPAYREYVRQLPLRPRPGLPDAGRALTERRRRVPGERSG